MPTPSLATAFSNTAPGTVTPGGATAFSNTAPGSLTPGAATAFSNTAPGSLTPGGASAFDNTAPGSRASASRVQAWARPTSNLASLTTTTGTIAGASLRGTLATRQDRLVLLTAQSTASQNGLYVANNGGSSVSLSDASYDSPDGEYVKTGLTAGRLYYWAPGSFGTSVEGAGGTTLTEAGFIEAATGGELTLRGTATEGVDATLKEANLERATAFDSAPEFATGTVVAVLGTTTQTWWVLTGAPATLGSSSIHRCTLRGEDSRLDLKMVKAVT